VFDLLCPGERCAADLYFPGPAPALYCRDPAERRFGRADLLGLTAAEDWIVT